MHIIGQIIYSETVYKVHNNFVWCTFERIRTLSHSCVEFMSSYRFSEKFNGSLFSPEKKILNVRSDKNKNNHGQSKEILGNFLSHIFDYIIILTNVCMYVSQNIFIFLT